MPSSAPVSLHAFHFHSGISVAFSCCWLAPVSVNLYLQCGLYWIWHYLKKEPSFNKAINESTQKAERGSTINLYFMLHYLYTSFPSHCQIGIILTCNLIDIKKKKKYFSLFVTYQNTSNSFWLSLPPWHKETTSPCVPGTNKDGGSSIRHFFLWSGNDCSKLFYIALIPCLKNCPETCQI